MPTPATIAITPGTGQLLDAVSVVVGGTPVVRETMVIADPTNATQLVSVSVGGALLVDASATVQPVSISGSVPVSGTITANIGTTNGLALNATLTGGTQLSQPYDGTNTIFTVAHPGFVQGTIAATQSGTWNIGTITTLPAVTFASPQHVIVDSATLGTVTISGNVTNAGTFAVQSSITTLGQQLAAASVPVVLTAAQITTLTPPTTVAVTNTGTFAVQATLAAETTKVIGTVNQGTSPWVVSLASTTVTQGAAGAATAPWYQAPGAPTTSQYLQAAISFSASGANTVVAGTAAQTIRIFRIFFVNGDATNSTNITIQDSTPTSLSGAFYLAPLGGTFSGDGGGDPLFTAASGKGFVINSSASVQLSGVVWYTKS